MKDALATTQEVELVETEIVEEISQENKDRAEGFLNQLISSDMNNPVVLIDSVGNEEVKTLKTLSKSLQGPIMNMQNDNSESAKIGKSLVQLKTKVEEINPSKFDFNPGWLGRTLQRITGSSAANKYFTKFQTTQSVIEAINKNLEEGKISLMEDNAIFQDDKTRYRQTTKSLLEKLQILQYTDTLLIGKIDETKKADEKQFLSNEVHFPLRQQIQDLQQTLAVTAQGVIALDILIKNNQELIRGVKRTQNVTLTALTIGATVAGGLANQKRVLETTNEVNKATNDIIATNANMLKTQGVEIQKQAATTMLNMEVLSKALKDTVEAIQDIEAFKEKALPEMKKSIDELNIMNSQIENHIQQKERAEQIKIGV